MTLIIPPMPVLAPLIQRADPGQAPRFTISEDYYRWLENEIRLRLQKTPPVLASASLTGQSATIPTTTLWTALQAGLYRISWYARITTPDAVSNSVTVTLGWTDGGVALTKAFAALTGITTATYGDGVADVHVDAGARITYAALYASNTPAAMKFRCDFSVEQLS